MKLFMEVSQKQDIMIPSCDGIILALQDFAVESTCFFSLKEIQDIISHTDKEVFIKVNKNFMNEEIDALKEILIKLDQLKVSGVFFYDLAVLEIKRECSLSLPLVWSQTHMVNNYKTCNYYYSKGVEYALLGKEITLEEIKQIIKNSSIHSMVEVISKPSVAFSKRKLITNFYKDLGKDSKKEIVVKEKMTDTNYRLREDQEGTSFFLDVITNGTGVIKGLYEAGCEMIIIREFGLEEIFSELMEDTYSYLQGKCLDSSYVTKYQKLGDHTNFFFRKTIYRVKKNG